MSTEKLTDAINQRIAQLGMSKAEVARRANISESLLHKTLSGKHKMGGDSARRVDVALGWPTGTLQAVLDHDAAPPTDLLSGPDRLQHLEEDVAALRSDIATVVTLVQQLVDDLARLNEGGR